MPLPALSSLPLPSEGLAEAHPARGEARGTQLRKAVPGGGRFPVEMGRWAAGMRGRARSAVGGAKRTAGAAKREEPERY